MRHTPFQIFPFDNKMVRSSSGPAPAPIGDLFFDDFNPQVGVYSDFGSGTHNITTSNMAVGGGNGFFNSGTILDSIIGSWGNWYLEGLAEFTNTNNGQFATSLGIISINGAQAQPVAAGPYYFDGANNALLYIFNQALNSGPVNPTQPGVTISATNKALIRLDFDEDSLTVTITNVDVPDSVQDSYSYTFTLATSQIKPNTGKPFILSPASTINYKHLRFGTNYLNLTDRLFQGDSITAGYYGGGISNRFANLYSVATGKTIAVCAGAGDRTIECSNATALNLYGQMNPIKVSYAAGTNDVTGGASVPTIISRINEARDFWEGRGTIFVPHTPLPRDGVSGILTLRNAMIAEGYTNLIDDYPHFEDSGSPGNIDPQWSDDGIHLNQAGNVRKKDWLITNGF